MLQSLVKLLKKEDIANMAFGKRIPNAMRDYYQRRIHFLRTSGMSDNDIVSNLVISRKALLNIAGKRGDRYAKKEV